MAHWLQLVSLANSAPAAEDQRADRSRTPRGGRQQLFRHLATTVLASATQFLVCARAPSPEEERQRQAKGKGTVQQPVQSGSSPIR